MKIAVFWLIALMMEAARTSETLVNFYQTTRCYNPEDSNLPMTSVSFFSGLLISVICIVSPCVGRYMYDEITTKCIMIFRI
jgi:hypothetical protein